MAIKAKAVKINPPKNRLSSVGPRVATSARTVFENSAKGSKQVITFFMSPLEDKLLFKCRSKL